eukprot:7187154-Pyramimonas_sp.AAC.1
MSEIVHLCYYCFHQAATRPNSIGAHADAAHDCWFSANFQQSHGRTPADGARKKYGVRCELWMTRIGLRASTVHGGVC